MSAAREALLRELRDRATVGFGYIGDPYALTPVESRDGLWFKRDDAFEINGARGGKVRACLTLVKGSRGALITASARKSPQSICVAAVAKMLNRSCRVHTAWGAETPELRHAATLGAEIVSHKPGYSTVIARRATDDAAGLQVSPIPFGMACAEAVELTAMQTKNLPFGPKRIVAPLGSGISLAGVLWGLKRQGRRLPVLGVVVGADPTRRLDAWAPKDWRSEVALVAANEPYARSAQHRTVAGIDLDPIYEGKCVPFLKRGDCFWIIGHRNVPEDQPGCG